MSTTHRRTRLERAALLACVVGSIGAVLLALAVGLGVGVDATR